jgi:hypothetical protein
MNKYDIPHIKKGPIFQIIRTCENLQKELKEYTLSTIPEDIQLLENIINQSHDFLERIDYYRSRSKRKN